MERLYKKKTICSNCRGELEANASRCTNSSCTNATTEVNYIETKNYPRILKIIASGLVGVLAILLPLVGGLVENDKTISDFMNFFNSAEMTSESANEAPNHFTGQLPATMEEQITEPIPMPDIQVVAANMYARSDVRRVYQNEKDQVGDLVSYIIETVNGERKSYDGNPRGLEFASYVNIYAEGEDVITYLPNDPLEDPSKPTRTPNDQNDAPKYIIYVSGKDAKFVTALNNSDGTDLLIHTINVTENEEVKFSDLLRLSQVKEIEFSLDDGRKCYAQFDRRPQQQ